MTVDIERVERALQEYKKDSEAYFPDDQEGWVLGRLFSKKIKEDTLVMEFWLEEQNERRNVSVSVSELLKNGFADLPPLKNPDIMTYADDLAQLSYLHEPAVFSGIKNRFSNRYIYTYSGIVLIAMNPFEKIDMYSPEVMKEYSGKRRDELEPHVFAVAEECYCAMLEGKNQSIIVSGESGAGKTVTTKWAMRYFATVDALSKIDDVDVLMRPDSVAHLLHHSKSDIEEAVLATNPILERNYHIFYQLCLAAPEAERKELGLASWENFHYLRQGNAGFMPTVDDEADFDATQKALSTIGISVSMQWNIFRICAALLHIGNINIKKEDADSCSIDPMDPSLLKAASLLELDHGEFRKWLTKRQIVTRGESFVKDLKASEALNARDSVSQFIYTRLFQWLVAIINKNLKRESKETEAFIGILDIYGFEHFEVNSFEQFCINYANEKLQQEFNSHVFRLEQELYLKEKIVWTTIDFNDNQPCIDLIEGKLGILDLLDEESRLPAGSDKSLIAKLNTRFAVPDQKFYEKPRFNQNAFTVKHYAVSVTYTADGFIEKNKDTVSAEQQTLMLASGFSFLKSILSGDHIESDPSASVISPSSVNGQSLPMPSDQFGSLARNNSTLRRGGVPKKPTLGSMFKQSLVDLMVTIRKTESHPNMEKTAFGFDGPMVLNQLRACGVLETIKISCAGYPNKMTHEQFAHRYYLLVRSEYWNMEPRQLCEKIVTSIISDTDKYQFGITQVFLRAGQLAAFENRRSERQHYLIVLGQKNVRRFLQRTYYLRLRQATIYLQAHIRGFLARKQAQYIRETRAAIKIQKVARGWLCRKRYRKQREAAVKIQKAFRRYVYNKNKEHLRRVKAAITIQSIWRGVLARREYRLILRKIVYIQSCIRRKYARRQLAALKEEARSVGKLREVNYSLETKVIGLSQALQGKTEEIRILTERLESLEHNLTAWKERCAKAENQLKSVTSELASSVDLQTSLQKELAFMSESQVAVVKERDTALKRIKSLQEKPVIPTFELPEEEEDGRARSSSRGRAGARKTTRYTRSPSNLSISSAANSHATAEDPIIESLKNENALLRRVLEDMQAGRPSESAGIPPPVFASVGMTRTPSMQSNRSNSSRIPSQDETPHLARHKTTFAIPEAAPQAQNETPGPGGIRRKVTRRAFSVYEGDIFADAERARVEKERQMAKEILRGGTVGSGHHLASRSTMNLGAHITRTPSTLVASPTLSPAQRHQTLRPSNGVQRANSHFVPSSAFHHPPTKPEPKPELKSRQTVKSTTNNTGTPQAPPPPPPTPPPTHPPPQKHVTAPIPTPTALDMEIIKYLEDPELVDEVCEMLIVHLPIPVLDTSLDYISLPKRDILFPAHLIGHLILVMLKYDVILHLQNMMNSIIGDIYNKVVNAKLSTQHLPIFWIANTQELIHIVITAFRKESKLQNNRSRINVLRQIHGDLQELVHQLLDIFLTRVRKEVATIAVPAVIETQQLPGLVTGAETGISSIWSMVTAATQVISEQNFGHYPKTMDGLKKYISDIQSLSKHYYLVLEHQQRILTELIRTIGVTSFNNLLNRRGFVNFKRGCQIQYNVTQIEEWCDKHRIPAAKRYMEPLMRASKLLTLNKQNLNDVGNVFETAQEHLNANQIFKLFQTYPTNDPDAPLSDAFRQILSARAKLSEDKDTIYFSMHPEPRYEAPAPLVVTKLETYIPTTVDVPTIALVVDIPIPNDDLAV
ncbi:Myosin type-2 heavy chain 1 [Chytridiales sp. JEL 0842]|nr:Myosin type-2 heavy chain 1 [Chytridiales sp. JEL 0842]